MIDDAYVRLPSFTGHSAACPMCGGGVGTCFCRQRHPEVEPQAGPVAHSFAPPHLDRVCRQCGYVWLESTLESERQAQPPDINPISGQKRALAPPQLNGRQGRTRDREH